MADDWWTDDDDDQGNDPPKPRDLPEPARQHMRKLEKELKALREENNTLKQSHRKNTVTDIVKAKGYNPAIASFVPSDVDVTDEAVGKWLETHGSLFAKPTTDGTDSSSDETVGDSIAHPEGYSISPQMAMELGLISNVTAGGVTPQKPADLLAKVQAANPAELMELLKSHGATV